MMKSLLAAGFGIGWLWMGSMVLAENTQYQMGFDTRDGVVDVFYFGNDDTYAAIAYSPATGKYGYANDCYSREIAERTALRYCVADDARIVGWVCNGFVALAVGKVEADGAWGTGISNDARASNTTAKSRALAACKQRDATAKIKLCVCSVKRKVEVFD